MSMDVNTKNQVADYASTGAKAAVTGAVVGGTYKIGKNLAPLASDCFKASVEKQEATIQAFKETGKTIADYVGLERKRIHTFDDPASIVKTARNLTQDVTEAGKAKVVYKDASKGKNFEDLISKIAEKGQKGALKDVDKTEKLLTNGKASKLEAVKDTVVEMFKDKAAFLKDNKTTILKKAGKTALIGAAVAGVVALASKAILDGKAKKEEAAE